MPTHSSRREMLRGAAVAPLLGLGLPARGAETCGGMSFADFNVYISRFNANDPGFIEFYHPEVVLELGETQIRGAQGIGDFYANVKRYIRERLEITHFISDEGGIAVEIPTTFECIADWEDSFWGRPLKKGEVMRIVSFVLYRVEEGRFKHIKSARYKMINDWQAESSA